MVLLVMEYENKNSKKYKNYICSMLMKGLKYLMVLAIVVTVHVKAKGSNKTKKQPNVLFVMCDQFTSFP